MMYYDSMHGNKSKESTFLDEVRTLATIHATMAIIKNNYMCLFRDYLSRQSKLKERGAINWKKWLRQLSSYTMVVSACMHD